LKGSPSVALLYEGVRLSLPSYKDKAAIGIHGSSDAFKTFQKTLKTEDLVGAPMQLKFVKEAGGFARL